MMQLPIQARLFSPRTAALLFASAALLVHQFGPANAGAGRNVEETEAWRVVVFWMVFLILSYWLETAFHNLHHYLEHRGAHGLVEALEKIKEELMVTGFVSLVLLVFEPFIVKICWVEKDMVWLEKPDDIVRGVSCCTLGHEYWSSLPTSGESKTVANSPLRYTCPSRTYVKDLDNYGQPLMPLVKHEFDCPINGPVLDEVRTAGGPTMTRTCEAIHPSAWHAATLT